MGTRSLICVFYEGKYRIAQYSQWDGYPTGQGNGCVLFLLKEKNIDKLKKTLERVRFYDEKKDKDFLDEYDKNTPEWTSDQDNRTPNQKRWWDLFQHRNIGYEILENLINVDDKEIILRNCIDFARDSLSCEWAYVIDLDKEVFEVYEGFNKSPIEKSERFYTEELEDYGPDFKQYYPVKLLKKYNFSDLKKNSMDKLEKNIYKE